MNWCQPHWEQLRNSIEAKGLTKFVSKDGADAIERISAEPTKDNFDPLLGSWAAINAYMLESPGLNGRVFDCPCCILVADKQPEMVERWIDGATSDALDYAISQGLVIKQ